MKPVMRGPEDLKRCPLKELFWQCTQLVPGQIYYFQLPMVAKQSWIEVRQGVIVQVDHLQLFGGEEGALLDINQKVVAEVNRVQLANVAYGR